MAIVKHIFTSPQADDPDTTIVRPSDWNSVHAVTAIDGFAAGTQTASSGTVVFANSNGISFGLSNSSQVTASYTVPSTAGLISNLNISAGTTSNNATRIVFSDANGITFGLNASTVTASVQTAYAASTHSHGNPSLALTNLSGTTASNSAGLTISLSAAAGGGGGADGYNILAAGTQTAGTASTVVFSNSNGISFGMSNSSQITASYTVPSTAGLISNLNISAGTTSNNATRVVFADSNGVTFGLNASTVTASVNTTYAASNHSHGNPSLALTNLSGTTASNSGGFTLSLSAAAAGGGGQSVGMSTIGNTSGDTGIATGQLVLAGGNNITLSGSTNAGSMTITISAPNLGGGGGFSAGLSTMGNTAGSTGLTGTNLVFVGNSPMSLSQSTGANGGTISINAPATSMIEGSWGVSVSTTGSTIRVMPIPAQGVNMYEDVPFVIGQVGQGTINIGPEDFPYCQFDRIQIGVYNTNSSNSSGSHTLSFWVGLYTKTASSISLFNSTSTSFAITHSGTAGSYSFYSGIRQVTIPITTTLPPDRYWIAVLSRTTSGGANGSYSQVLVSQLNSNFVGDFGASHATTRQWILGQGVYTATSSGMPGSIAFSQIRGSDSMGFRAPYVAFVSGTA